MKIGLSLSGGGVRSAAQLGLVQALYEEGIRPRIFTGTSGGAVVATLLALGKSPNQALERFSKTNGILDIAYWSIAKSILTRNPVTGIYSGDKLRNILSEIFDHKRLIDVSHNIFLPTNISLAIVATDIGSGKQVIFSSDEEKVLGMINDDNYEFTVSQDMHLSFAVSASTRLPAVFMPMPYKNGSGEMLLVDGGLTNNLPSDVAFALGAERVISIDLGYAGQTREIGGLYSILKQSLDVMMERGVDINMENMDIYLNPEVYDVKVLDLDRIDECFMRGYEYGKNNMDKIIFDLEYGKRRCKNVLQ